MSSKANKTTYFIIAITAIVNFILHLTAGFNSGFHGDELLHIEAGRHLAFGYMDFAPLIAYLAFIQNLFHSDSMFVNHLFVYIASALIIILSGLIAVRLRGNWLSVLVVMLCILFAPGFAASHSLFLPVIFEQLAWVACIYCLVSFCENSGYKYLYGITIVLALGFLSKYSIVFLIGGIVLSILSFQVNLLKTKEFWLATLLFLLIIMPNIIWQINKGFPVFHHFSKLYETQLDNNSRFDELKSLFLSLNPFTSIFWIAGIVIVPFVPGLKRYRLAAVSLSFAFIFLIIAKGKAYYYFPVVLGILPMGAVFVEHLLEKRKWILVSYLALLSFFGILILPKGMPVLPLDKYIRLYNLKQNSEAKIPIYFENYYSKGIWDQILSSVGKTYRSLPVEEQKQCLVWGRHYAQAGGINLLGKRLGLPKAFSFHSSFYNWVPIFTNKVTIIVIADPEWDTNHWLRFFDEVKQVAVIPNPYNPDKKWDYQSIYLCRKLKYNSTQLKEIFKNEIF